MEDEGLLISQEDMTRVFVASSPYRWLGRSLLRSVQPSLWTASKEITGCGRKASLARGGTARRGLPVFAGADNGVGLCGRHCAVGPQKDLGHRVPTDAEIAKTTILPTAAEWRFLRGWQVYLDHFATLTVESMQRHGKAENGAR